MDGPPRTAPLESRIGYRFSDRTLLERALVRRSWAEDKKADIPDNERLEFLGDAVLGLVVAERLFRDFGDDEGRLTRARTYLVRRETLAQQARKIELGKWLRLSRGEEIAGGRDRDSILCNAFEALLGAIYCDGGLVAAQSFVERVMGAELARRGEQGTIHSPVDPRTVLQELMQAAGDGKPDYRVLGTDGPGHELVWTVEVRAQSHVLGTGSGRSKQDAAREAATEAMEKLAAGEGRGPA